MNKDNKVIIKHLIFLFFLILPFGSVTASIYPSDTVIYFGNGVWNTYKDASKSQDVLENKLFRKLNGSNIQSLLVFDVSYNRSDGALEDLAEAFKQVLQLDFSHFWAFLGGLSPIPDGIRNEVIEISTQIDAAVLENNPDVQAQVLKYNKKLKECKRVVIVAHSQGNLFANLAYLGIEPTLLDAFGIISVANPDSKVAGEMRFPDISYTTINEDLIISSIFTSLRSNVNNYPILQKYSPIHGHDFVKNYLDTGNPAETKILNNTIAMVEELLKFKNIDYCGWPVIYSDSGSIIREPYDKDKSNTPVSSLIWDKVWSAAQNNNLIMEYRLGRGGSWVRLNQRNLFTDYAYYHAGSSHPDSYQVPPFVFFNHNESGVINQTIQVQPDDIDFGIPMGIQQFRITVGGKVIEQFTLDYDQEPWIEIKTSRPVTEPLLTGSHPITKIPEI